VILKDFDVEMESDMNKHKLIIFINRALALPEQLWWQINLFLAVKLEKFGLNLVKIAHYWQNQCYGIHGSVATLGDEPEEW
jgi:hypothetical protein